MLTENDVNLYWQYCLYIEKDLEATTRFVEVNEANYNTYSAEFAKIVMLACSEIDVICKLLCKEINSSFDDSNGNIKKYTDIILNRFPKLTSCELYNNKNQDTIKPLEDWSINPYHSPKWWNDYQKIKHQRHNNFNKATLKNALSSVAGLIILDLYLYRIVVGEPYAIPSVLPKIFDAKYFSQIFTARAENELPDFENVL